MKRRTGTAGMPRPMRRAADRKDGAPERQVCRHETENGNTPERNFSRSGVTSSREKIKLHEELGEQAADVVLRMVIASVAALTAISHAEQIG